MTTTTDVRVEPGSERRSVARAATSLANYWHPIGLASDVDGSPRKFTLLGEDVVAFRHEGRISVMRDLCIHRGTRLSLGYLVDGRIVCPYHGWEYDCSGACVHIPSLPPGSAIPKKARTDVYSVQEMYGLVWVALADPAAPIPVWPDTAWGEGSSFTVFLAWRQRWEANAGRSIENAMDFSHFNFLHRGLTELEDGPIVKPHEVDVTEYGLHYSYHDSVITREYMLYAPFTLHDRKEEGNGKVSILTMIASPIDANTTDLYHFIGRNHDTAIATENRGGQQEQTQVIDFAERVAAQDREVVESQRPEMIPLDLRDELHLKVPDASGMAYRKLLASIAGSAPFMP